MNMKTVFGIKKPNGSSELEPRSYRSSSYESQFQDYTQYMEVRGSGKKRLVRSYAGDYYTADMTDGQYVLRKIGYLLLFGASVAGFVAYAACGYLCSWNKPLAVLEMLVLFSLLWSGLKLLFYLTAARKMTIGEYKGSCVALKSAAKWSVIFFYSSAAVLLCSELVSRAPIREWIVPLGWLLLDGLGPLCIFFAEKKTSYFTIANAEKKSQ